MVGDNIEQPEVMSLRDALNKADEMGLDLVEISPNLIRPYAGSSIIRNSFISRRKRRKIKSKIVKVVVKEIRFGPNTDDHDYDFKLKHAENFLKEGAKVKSLRLFSEDARSCSRIRAKSCCCVSRPIWKSWPKWSRCRASKGSG